MQRRSEHGLGAVAAAVALSATLTGTSSAVDLWVESVELTQAIQDRNPPFPMIAGKEIFVRVIVGIDGSVPNLDARVSVTTFSGTTTYKPLNLSSFTAPPVGSVNLTFENNTLNFCIVVDDEGPASIGITLDPDDVVAEDDETNNELFLAESIECRRTPSIGYLRIAYGGVSPNDDKVGAGSGELFARAVLPVPDIDYRYVGNTAWFICDPQGAVCGNILLARLFLLRTGITPNRPDHLFGWIVAPGGMTAGLGYIPGRVAWGTVVEAQYRSVFAHETGHNLKLSHTGGTLDWYGADVRSLVSTGTIIKGLNFDELMVTSTVTSTTWVDIHEYDAFINHDRFTCDPPFAPDAGTGGEEVVVFTGTYDGVTATIDEVFTIEGAEPEPPDDPGGLLIARTLDGAVVVDEVRFDPAAIGDATVPSPDAITVALHRTAPGLEADAIEILDAGTNMPIGGVAASPAAPSASFISPSAGATIADGTMIEWSMSDTDGDDVRAILNWSWDDGASWIPMTFADTITSAEFDGTLPGSTAGTGRLRLDVSDGFHTTVVELAGLTFDDRKPPVTAILSPGDVAVVTEGVGVHFTGAAYDVEQQRSLDGAEVWWTSDVDGLLGTGRSVIRADLTPGVHVITFEAIDRDGMTSSDTVVVGIDEDDGAGCLGAGVEINEVRIAQPGPAEPDEFFELVGPPGTVLDCLYYVAVNRFGDVQEVTDLSGNVIPPDGFFLVGQSDPMPGTGASPQLVTPLTFFNVEDHTHLLVSACGGLAGIDGADLDADDDGTLEGAPWDCVVDCIGLDGNSADGHLYCATRVGPTPGGTEPAYAHRCSPIDLWQIGPIDLPPMGLDTPGMVNVPCPFAPALTAFGLDHVGTGAAGLLLPAGGPLHVSDIGSSGLDGVSIDLGPAAEFGCVELEDITDILLRATGAALTATAVGDIGGRSGEALSSTALTKVGASALEFDASFPVVPGSVVVSIMMDGVLHVTEPLLDPTITIAWPDLPGGPLPPVLEFVPKPGALFPDDGLGTTLTLGSPASVTVDGATFVADAIVVRPASPTPYDAMTAITLGGSDGVGGNLPSLGIGGELLGIFGQAHRALGDATMDTAPGGANGAELIISNIGSSGLDGVRQITSFPLGSVVGWMTGLDVANDVPDQSSVILDAGRLVDGTDPLELFELVQTNVQQDTAIILDATPLPGVIDIPISYRLRGTEVFGTSQPGPVANLVLPTDLLDRHILKIELDDAANMLYVRRCALLPFEVPGQTGILADEVVLCLPAPEVLDPAVTELDLELRGIAGLAAVAGTGTMGFTLDGEGPIVEICTGDSNGDGSVDVTDLVNVILDWGTDGSGHGGDIDGSGLVDVQDLVAVILAWGPCA